ncbi:MAG TPA: GH3 auxin-responsive promoter family protein [Thermoanaerobaculia bacterium]|nr:GH3 auxin-responsive promoter family protein [Thermoanaerobaculia bacterium]
MRPLCIAANGLWLLSSLPSAIAFRANLHRVAEVQEDVLLRILSRDPRYASIRSVREYQQQVPIRTFDEMDLSDVPGVTHWERTSGSSGASKRIPYTRELLAEFNRAIAPWVIDLFVKHPTAFAGEAYWSVSPVLEDREGFVTDEEYLGPVRARLVRAVQAVPRSVRLAADVDTFRQETLRHLVRCRTLSLISVWHPSFLSLLLAPLWTLDDPRVQHAARHQDDAEMHRELWPHLRVISCWADANAERGAAELGRLFPQATVVPKGLLSTEGFISFPLLAYRSHFFEFRSGDEVLLASEVQAGQQYQVILTTGGGLYRYDTEDLVEVTGFRGKCPTLRFVGRANHVSDHYGEKLNELFVRERLERALREHGIASRFAMLACEERAYALFIESDAPDASLIGAVDTLEASLRENIHYDYCRRLGQLDALTLFRIRRDGVATYLTSDGAKLGDVKPTALDRRGGWGGRFEGEFVRVSFL